MGGGPSSVPPAAVAALGRLPTPSSAFIAALLALRLRRGALVQPDGQRAGDVHGRVRADDDADQHRRGEVEDLAHAEDEQTDQRQRGHAGGEDGAATACR